MEKPGVHLPVLWGWQPGDSTINPDDDWEERAMQALRVGLLGLASQLENKAPKEQP